MPASRFLFSCAACFIAMLVLYGLLAHRTVSSAHEPVRFYPQMLLEVARKMPGKVVVEGGSSSQLGIDPSLLSSFFKAPVIITAMNAGFPLGPKIHNLERYLLPGDVLLLPLEWNQYAYEKDYPTDFVEQVSGPGAQYGHLYNNLPWLGKVQFIFSRLPLARVRALWTESQSSTPAEDRQASIWRVNAWLRYARSGDSRAYGGNLRPGPESPSPGMYSIAQPDKLRNCDSYLFGGQFFRGSYVSHSFLDNLQLLTRLRETGVRVYFTWPAVVDHENSACYTTSKIGAMSFEDYATRLTRIVEEAGFQFVGKPEESHFPPECFLNTYYHLTASCAKRHTRRLLRSMRELQFDEVNSTYEMQEVLDRAIDRLQQELKQARKVAKRH